MAFLKRSLRSMYALLLCLLLASTSRAATLEYQLEAAFLFNFTQFVEWPPTAFQVSSSPLVIGVLGEDPFGSYLDDIVRGEMINGHPLTVERYHTIQEVRRCHILFFADSESTIFHDALIKLRGRNILTVSNLADFAKAGGIVRFQIVDNRVRFHINVQVAHDEQLAISSKLLKQADIIGEVED